MPGNLPLVSVLMTSFNREKYIGESIESVMRSTYQNFELIIVDDCSSDGTLRVAREYAGRDPRIRVYQNEKNLGDYHNRNKAVSYATGIYLKFVDSDDIIYPDSLNVFVSGMEKFPDAAVGVMSLINQEDKPYPFQLTPAEAYHYHFYIRGMFDTGPSALIFRASRFREIGGFSGQRYVGDTEINLRMAARWPMVRLSSSLVYWRKHEGQEIVAGLQSKGYLELQLPLIVKELNDSQCPLSEKERRDIIAYYKRISAREIIKMALANRRTTEALKIYQKLPLVFSDFVDSIILRKRKY